MITRLATFALIVAVLVFFVDREAARGSLDRWERSYLSWLEGNAKRFPGKTNVVHLTLENLDREGAAGIFDQWPPGAIDYALLFENLAAYSPRTVVVEPVLHWADGSELATSILAEKLSGGPSKTFACVLQNDPTAAPQAASLSPLEAFSNENISGALDAVPEFTRVLLAPAESLISSSEATAGFSSIDLTDSIGPVGKVPLLARNQQSIVPSLPLAALLAYYGVPPEDVKIEIGSRIQLTPEVIIPIDPSGALVLPPAKEGRVTTIPADALFLDEDSREIIGISGEESGLGKIAGSLVVLGFSENESSNSLTTTLATVQSAHYPTELDRQYQYGIWGTLTLLGAFIVARPTKSLFPAFFVALLYITTCLLIFGTSTIWWPSVTPLTIIATSLILGHLLPPARPAASTDA